MWPRLRRRSAHPEQTDADSPISTIVLPFRGSKVTDLPSRAALILNRCSVPHLSLSLSLSCTHISLHPRPSRGDRISSPEFHLDRQAICAANRSRGSCQARRQVMTGAAAAAGSADKQAGSGRLWRRASSLASRFSLLASRWDASCRTISFRADPLSFNVTFDE